MIARLCRTTVRTEMDFEILNLQRFVSRVTSNLKSTLAYYLCSVTTE